MFRLFTRLDSLLQLALVLAIATLLILPAFLHPLAILPARETLLLHSLIVNALVNSPLIGISIAPAIMLFQAFVLYFFAVSNGLHPRDSLLTVLFYFIIAASLQESIILSPALAASVLLFFSLFLMVNMQDDVQAYKQVFSASFCMSVAALLYPPAVLFILFIWMGLLTYRIASWHEWVISFIGFCIPVLYLLTYYFWKGQLQEFFTNYISLFSNVTHEFPKFRLWQLIFLGFTGLLLLLAVFRQLILIQDKLISIRRKTWIIVDFMIVAAVSGLLSGSNLPGHLAIIALPGALFLANMFSTKKASWTFEILAGLLLILLVMARVYV